MNSPGEKREFRNDDEVGKPIWRHPKEIEDTPDVEDDEEDFDISPLPSSTEVGIHAPQLDPELQRDWEERERIRREEEAEREKRENPRGVWETD